MVFSIFNNTRTVCVDDSLIKEYESNVAPVDSHRVEYFIASSGADEKSDDLEGIVNLAIKEEISINKKLSI